MLNATLKIFTFSCGRGVSKRTLKNVDFDHFDKLSLLAPPHRLPEGISMDPYKTDVEFLISSDLIRENRDQKNHERFRRTRGCRLCCKCYIRLNRSVGLFGEPLFTFFRLLIESVLETHGQQINMLLTAVVK